MIIANPIYDAVFKRLLENNRVAKFLIGTILDCKIISIAAETQEHTTINKDTGKLTLYRKDFTATIETKDEGTKTVIVEMQKAKRASDIGRFREYLGNEYTKSKYPIIAIYILGFDLATPIPAFAAFPECYDLHTKEKTNVKDRFVEHLTHKTYFVQANKIKPSLNSKLDEILSIFGQNDLVADDKTKKNFTLEPQDEEMKEVLRVLQFVAGDESIRAELSAELYYDRYVEDKFGEKDREIEEKNREIEEKEKEIDEKEKELEEKNSKLLKTVQKLKQRGLSVEEISEITGLSLQEIENLN